MDAVLTRDVEALEQDHASRRWQPSTAELRFAEDLARTPWTETSIEIVIVGRP
ncbi:hypothetical protein OG250_42585 [Streptomyces sp. NBC_00487]|uniref:hypothetical protein n=1 Tax=unclassified Streptomyces TaxID=2593676 RepID=UPI002E1983D3|nr:MULTISPECIES: hypothetical protein [unclassified Streptomyces]